MKQLLKLISKHTKGRYKFAEVRNNIAYYVACGRKIPEHCIRYPKQKKMSDGVYKLNEYTCGGSYGGCRIGKPSQKCIERGIMNPNQCGRYVFDDIGNFLLTPEELKEIVKSANTCQIDINW